MLVANAEDYEMLAKTTWGEARNQELLGQIAVMWVIRNRAERRYGGGPGSCKKAALAPWQFSCWNPGDPNRPLLEKLTIEDPIYASMLGMSTLVVNGQVSDPTGGADHYHTLSIAPNWAAYYKRTIAIGDHVFYNSELKK